jgi:homocitrate synthase
MEDVDIILRIYHTGIHSGDLKIGQSAVLDKLLEKVSSTSEARKEGTIMSRL